MLLLLTGHPRSGTTMLRTICHAHPDVAVTQEFGIFRTLNVPLTLYTIGMVGRMWERKIRPTLPKENKRRGIWRSHRLELAYLRNLRRLRPSLVQATHIEAALQPLFPGVRYIGDKYPNYIFQLDAYVAVENLKTVVIYRDVRDVVASYVEHLKLKRQQRPVFRDFNTPEKITRNWIQAITCMQRNRAWVHLLRYEDLVCNPAPVLQALGQFLDVDPAGFPADLIHADSVGRYAERLSAADLAVVEQLAGSYLSELGYA